MGSLWQPNGTCKYHTAIYFYCFIVPSFLFVIQCPSYFNLVVFCVQMEREYTAMLCLGSIPSESKSLKNSLKLDVMVHICSPSTWKAEARRSPWVWASLGYISEFKGSLHYLVRHCLKKRKLNSKNRSSISIWTMKCELYLRSQDFRGPYCLSLEIQACATVEAYLEFKPSFSLRFATVTQTPAIFYLNSLKLLSDPVQISLLFF